MSTEEMNAAQGPVGYSPVVRVFRALGLAFSTGMLALFICRDLMQTSSTVYASALAVGAVAGVALELAASAVERSAGTQR
jgi:hypothetical protein